MRISVVFLVLFFCLDNTDASISSGFYKFLKLKYGKQYADNVARMDYGPVAGWASTAAFSWPAYVVWKMHGYTNAELYGTTYGLPAGLFSVTWGLRCQFTRTLIKAVAEFTNSKVNVIAYSMGGPISRKAILGGKCVDTDEDLGPPLTNIVDVYLGVAGAMNGALACKIPNVGSCSLQSGMNCHSTYIKDINKQSRYEGAKVYVLQSLTDQVVGYRLCGKHASEIEGANRTVTTFTLDGLIEIINSIANNAAEVLEIKPEICKLILPLYHWSSQSLLEKFYEVNSKEKFLQKHNIPIDFWYFRFNSTPGDCAICCEISKLDGLDCGHLYCDDCWRRYCEGKIRDEAQWLFSCPSCELLINENALLRLVDDERILSTYKRLLINSYVSTNPRIKWCPATDCIFATEVPIAETCGVPCQCGHIFCFDCGSEWHQPASCDAMKKWMKAETEDQESIKWLHTHSKPCPKCKMYVSVLEKMEAIQNAHQCVQSETRFLQRAFDTLVRSRRTLMYSYVFAFYLEKNNQSTIFEDNQGILEVTMEILSNLLERELNSNLCDLNQWKRNVQDQSFRLQQQRNNLIKHVNSGVENGELNSQS
ncbi:RBR-type E3 ubiquitin transferase [Aphelenchoides besseyi]|nr:RBR-type E3 ubiquitin transferase [Aphelenchoides besseyi]KAI6197368.1 RBR-type E3 ubiquitin transferase [Aphelenchoides besseyi]